ncbi:MAG: 5-formyltetrahydrofolate cyclo-ligase [Micrococcales bacterium]|nr:5-formyltetrahydrofolate cyclo-ligase [Micrococcales bacterium]
MPHRAQPYPAAHETDEPGDHKERFRTAIRQVRARRSTRRLDEAGAGLAHVVREIPQVTAAGTVAAYVSRKDEPPTGPLLEALVADGVRVLLPVLGERLARQWAVYDPSVKLVVRAPGRPPEPPGPALGAEAVTEADVILVPALAIDTTGRRIGQGGGWYDRALTLARPDALSVAIVFETELYDATRRPLPDETHDQRVRAVATPQRWRLTAPDELTGSDEA